MTLSAVSMQMKSLEEQLGAHLFDRRFRPPKLTPLGIQVAEDAPSHCRNLRIAAVTLCFQPEIWPVHFGLGFVPSAGARVLPGLLKVAGRTSAKCHVSHNDRLCPKILCDQVRNGQLEAAIVTEIEDATTELFCETLVREEMVVAVPASSQARGLK